MAETSQVLLQAHQSRTYVGIFKSNYLTNPELAIAAYQAVQNRSQWPDHFFLYNQQLVELGLGQFRPDLVLDRIFEFDKSSGVGDDARLHSRVRTRWYGRARLLSYQVYQACLTNPAFKVAALEYFQHHGNNPVAQALLARPDGATDHLLHGQIPNHFLTRPKLINLALALHLDQVWLRPEVLQSGPITAELFLQLDLLQLGELTRRVFNLPQYVEALTRLGLLDGIVYCALILLTQGATAYFQALTNLQGRGLLPEGYGYGQHSAEILDQISRINLDQKLALSPSQWAGILSAINPVTFTQRAYLNRVKIASKVVLASLHHEYKILLGTALATTADPRIDLTTIMAGFELTEADLAAHLSTEYKDSSDRWHLSYLLPWYSGSTVVLEQFLNLSLQHAFWQGNDEAVTGSIYWYLVAASRNVNLRPVRLVPVRPNETCIIAYWLRRFYPKPLPGHVLARLEDDNIIQRLVEYQGLVEVL